MNKNNNTNRHDCHFHKYTWIVILIIWVGTMLHPTTINRDIIHPQLWPQRKRSETADFAATMTGVRRGWGYPGYGHSDLFQKRSCFLLLWRKELSSRNTATMNIKLDFWVMWAVRQMPAKIDWNYIGCCTKLYYKTSPYTVVNIPFHDLLVVLRYTCNIEFQEILQNGRKSTKRELDFDFEKPPAGEDELLYFPEIPTHHVLHVNPPS